MATAARTQAPAIRLLRGTQAAVNSFDLMNAIAVEHADLDLTCRLAALPEVSSISVDPDITFSGPMAAELTVTDRNTIEWGVEKINAPAVWALGYTGQGITVGGADTGYEWMHPAGISRTIAVSILPPVRPTIIITGTMLFTRSAR